MNLTRIAEAPTYFAPNHDDMRCLRLQGKEAGPSDKLWLGMSQLLPGGGTSLDGSPVEKHYVVLEGELTIRTELDGVLSEQKLGRFDSCRIAPGEKRQLFNHTNLPAIVLLAMPLA
ncbi:hypothetical protein SAMN06265795_11468 [Noviherbaspirillum humi]|uniref:Cupin domain-containing protein n=1 Tax=Noviherbaspirillum humi TaxID=1688639 RepID=A0A239K181_9BURK|nr:cupin domain-containing protein [Noviherbaspirillum humi]SNT11443.1 hypothetical protein SAMN06265795_11468 [Noviherbaspirillum humi]